MITAQGFEAMPRLVPACFVAFRKADLAKRTPVLRATELLSTVVPETLLKAARAAPARNSAPGKRSAPP
jgi:hypothetical protein